MCVCVNFIYKKKKELDIEYYNMYCGYHYVK